MTSAKIQIERYKRNQSLLERVEIGMMVASLLCMLYVGVHVLIWIARQGG